VPLAKERYEIFLVVVFAGDGGWGANKTQLDKREKREREERSKLTLSQLDVRGGGAPLSPCPQISLRLCFGNGVSEERGLPTGRERCRVV